jgi:3-keto-5-aminohexanoate cleavage enzyme
MKRRNKRVDEFIWDYRNPYEWMKRVRTTSLPPLMICCALTGGGQGKEANPNLPETPEEQAEQAFAAYKAGATMIHIHARDPNNWASCSGDPAQYRLVNALIRDKCPNVIINNSTGGGPGMTPEERICVVDANPEMASLNMGPAIVKMTLKERGASLPHPREEFHFEGCIPHDYAEITMFAQRMKDKGIKPEMEIYQPGMFWVAEDLIRQNLIDPPYLFQFVLGYQASLYPTPANLLSLITELPHNSLFEVLGVGPFQIPMTVMAILLGGHLRVGMEDNVYLKRGKLLESNAEAVERIVRIAREMNRDIATPAQARAMLGLSSTPSSY